MSEEETDYNIECLHNDIAMQYQEILLLKEENELLKRKLNKAMECINKYADKNYWNDSTGRGTHYIECPYEDIEEVWDNTEDKPLFIGGYQARIAKKEIEEMG